MINIIFIYAWKDCHQRTKKLKDETMKETSCAMFIQSDYDYVSNRYIILFLKFGQLPKSLYKMG